MMDYFQQYKSMLPAMNKILRCKQNICLYAFLLFSMTACSQIKNEFTAFETQVISAETPGLFDRSESFSVDFSTLKSNEYSFPLPVGKAVVVNNNADVEITTTKGDAVKAMFDGVVRLSKNNPPFGNVIVIRHDNGLETVYGNNAQNLVKVGQKVRAGQTIAIVGGEFDRVFCTFSIMVSGRRINPETILDVNSHRLRKQTVIFERQGKRIQVRVERPERQSSDKQEEAENFDPFAKSNVYKWNLAKIEKSKWAYPLPGSHVISPYGGKRGHSGVDIKTKPNDNILAAFDGVVTRSGPFSGYGNCIIIKHNNGLETLYSHQSKNLVKVGQKVKAGQVIGLTGRTGRATTEHLHFETHFKGRRFNPAMIFDHNTKTLKNVTLVFNKNGSITSQANTPAKK